MTQIHYVDVETIHRFLVNKIQWNTVLQIVMNLPRSLEETLSPYQCTHHDDEAVSHTEQHYTAGINSNTVTTSDGDGPKMIIYKFLPVTLWYFLQIMYKMVVCIFQIQE